MLETIPQVIKHLFHLLQPVNSSSIDLLSDTGGILASVLLSPLSCKNEHRMFRKHQFYLPVYRESLNADVLYDLSVFYPKRSQVILFPIAGDYKMSITINGLQTASGQKQDDAPYRPDKEWSRYGNYASNQLEQTWVVNSFRLIHEPHVTYIFCLSVSFMT